jgi:hypothetical protein
MKEFLEFLGVMRAFIKYEWPNIVGFLLTIIISLFILGVI